MLLGKSHTEDFLVENLDRFDLRISFLSLIDRI